MAVQFSALPIRKVLAGGLSGLATLAVIYAGRRWLGWDIDADLASGLVLLIGNGVAYFVPPALRDKIVALDGELRRVGEAGRMFLALVVGLGALSACSATMAQRFADRAGPAIAAGCAAFDRAEASPVVQAAVVAGSIASPAAGTAVGILKSFGNRFCTEGPPPGDTTSAAERAAWLAGVTAGMVEAAAKQ